MYRRVWSLSRYFLQQFQQNVLILLKKICVHINYCVLNGCVACIVEMQWDLVLAEFAQLLETLQSMTNLLNLACVISAWTTGAVTDCDLAAADLSLVGSPSSLLQGMSHSVMLSSIRNIPIVYQEIQRDTLQEELTTEPVEVWIIEILWRESDSGNKMFSKPLIIW